MVKKVLLWIVGIFGVLILIGMIAGPSNPPEQQAAGEAQAAPAAVAKAEPAVEVVKVSAGQLFKDYDDNEVATDERLKGKMIEVSGSIQSIDKNFMDEIVIRMRTSNEFMSAGLTMEDSEKAKAMELKKGQKVTARCKKMMRVMGSPQGSDCTFV